MPWGGSTIWRHSVKYHTETQLSFLQKRLPKENLHTHTTSIHAPHVPPASPPKPDKVTFLKEAHEIQDARLHGCSAAVYVQ